MKSKRLTIFFFSVMMLVATPRVMSHFKSYAGALHQKVETEWLNFLLGVAAPPDVEKNVATPQDPQQPAICKESLSKDAEQIDHKSRPEAKVTPGSLVSKKRTFEYKLTNLLSEVADDTSESASKNIPVDRRAFERVVHDKLRIPLATNEAGRAKVEYLWTLTQATLVGKRKAARALVREVSALTSEKSRPVGIMRVKYEKEFVQPPEPDPDVPERETSNSHDSSDESMR